MGEIDYPVLVRAAMQDLVRGLVARAAEEGLPGEHHFYLSFRTGAPGVELPAALRQRFPGEMTIVLQHQFWGLEATEEGFSVTLRFGAAPTRVHVPWDALTAFADPSASFGLRLAPEPEEAAGKDAAPAEAGAGETPRGNEPTSTAPQPSPAIETPSRPNVVAFRRRDHRE